MLTHWLETKELMEVDVTGTTLDELGEGVHDWAVGRLKAGDHDDAVYAALLVDLDEDNYYDSALAERWDDVYWFGGVELVPAE